MELADEITIPAPRAKVYDALNDVEILKACIPGCEELDKESDTELVAKVTLKVGPVKARFSGRVTLDRSRGAGLFQSRRRRRWRHCRFCQGWRRCGTCRGR